MTRSEIDDFGFDTPMPVPFTHHVDLSADGHHAVELPNAALVFSGTYVRHGLDLVVSRPFESVTIHDYFKLGTRAALKAPGGASLDGAVVEAITHGHGALYADNDPAGAPKAIGRVETVTGNAIAIRNGQQVTLHTGDLVYKGDAVQTDDHGTLAITFLDGTAFNLSANAKMVLNEMVYEPGGTSNSALLSLVQGSISFVAGDVAHSGDMKIDTPVATMGIRGTAVHVEIGADDGKTQFSVMKEPNGRVGNYVLYDRSDPSKILGTVSDVGTTLTIQLNNGVVMIATAPKSNLDLSHEQDITSQVFQTFQVGQQNPLTQQLTASQQQTTQPHANTPGQQQSPASQPVGSSNAPDAQTSLPTPVIATTPIVPTAPPAAAAAPAAEPGATPGVATTTTQTQTQTQTAPVIPVPVPVTEIVLVNKNAAFDATAHNTGLLQLSVAADDRIQTIHAANGATVGVAATGTTIQGTYGDLTVASDGTFHYVADHALGLLAGQLGVDTFTYTTVNAAGSVATATLTFDVRGASNDPIVSGPIVGGTILKSATVASLNLLAGAVDPNPNEAVTVATDANGHPAVTVTVVSSPFALAGVAFTVDASGHLSIDPSQFTSLGHGESLTLQFTYTLVDASGGATPQTATLTINGGNDAPVLSADPSTTHALTEVAGVTNGAASDTTSITLGFTDVDVHDTHTVSQALVSAVWSGGGVPAATLAALTSALSLSETDSTGTQVGSVTATFALIDKLADFLASGETLTVTYDITVTDDNGASSTKPVSITITGTNDAPVLSADTIANHAIAETAGVAGSSIAHTVSTTLAFTDTDLNDTHTVSQTLASAVWSGGTIPTATQNAIAHALSLAEVDSTHSGAGSVAAAFSLADSFTDFLAAGETLTLTYDVTVTDNNGAFSTQPVTFTITGTNDAPVLATDTTQSHAITEISGVTNGSGADTTSVTLAFTDVDLNNTHTVSSTLVSDSWSRGFIIPAATQTALANALHLIETDSTHSGAGSVTATFSLPDHLADFLAAGETITATYNITVTDSSGATSTQPITITLTGTNDTPVLASDTVATHIVSETPGLTGSSTADATSVTLGFTDVDLTDTHTVKETLTSAVWSGGDVPQATQAALLSALSLNGTDSTFSGSGSITASLGLADHFVDFLAAGETLTVVYTITVTDEHGAASSRPVSFTITGTNDAPVLLQDGTSVQTPVFTGDHGLGANGTSVSLVVPAVPASLSGVDTAAGVTVADTHGTISNQPVSFVIAGTTLDHAVTEIAGTTGSAIPDTSSTTLNFTDVDLNDTHTVTLGAPASTWSKGPLAGLTAADTTGLNTALASALSYTLTDSTHSGVGSIAVAFAAADHAFDFLAAGEKLTVVYNVTVTDNNGAPSTQPVTFVVTGTNDAPVLAADTSSHAIVEKAGLTGSAAADTSSTTLTFTDVDLSDMHTVTLGAPAATWSFGPLAGLTAADTAALNTALATALSYTLTDSTQTGAGSIAVAFSAHDSAFDFLAAGQTLSVIYTVTVTDNNGAPSTQPVTFIVTGTNDAPVLAADASASHAIVEKAGLTGSAAADTSSTTLTFTDVDLSDMHTVTLGAPAATWSFGPLAGLTAADTTALNTALASALSYTLTDATQTGAGSIAVAFSTHDSAFDFLAAGQTLSVIYTVTVTDNTGATSTQPVTFVVTGTNDAPVLAADTTASHAITELASTTGSATADTSSTTLTFTDVDLSDAHTVTLGAPAATWSVGPLSGLTAADTTALNTALASALSYTLTDSAQTGAGSVAVAFSAADHAFDFLAAGETLTVVYNVTVTDNNGATSTQPVTFVVTGTNDAPVLAADTSASHAIVEKAGLTGSAAADTSSTTLTFTDVDLSDMHTVTLGAPAATWSAGPLAGLTAADTAALNTSLANALSYTLTDSTQTGAGSVAVAFSSADHAFDFLAAGETLTVVYNVTVTDNNGAPSTQPVTFVVTGTNDAPVLAADTSASHAITEHAGLTGSSTADTSSTTLTFTDVDLSDAHTVTLGAPAATWSFGPLAGLTAADTTALNTALASALSYTLHDSTQTGAGSIAVAFSAADHAFDFLAAGEKLTVVYNVTVTDNNGAPSTQPITFVVTGTNDAPVLAADTTASHAITEHAGLTGSATADTSSTTLTFTDVDLTDTHTVTLGAPAATWSVGPLAGLTAADTTALNTALASALSYTLTDSTQTGAGSIAIAFSAHDSVFDFLAAGETLTVVYNVTVTDNNGAPSTQPVTFVVTGTNDAPVLAADASASHVIAEHAGLTGSATADTSSTTLTFTDVDLSDAHTVTLGAPAATWSFGPLTGLTAADTTALNTALASALSYTLHDSTLTGAGSIAVAFSAHDSAFDFLAAGETLTVVDNVTVTDNTGATSTQPITFVVTGTNDAPVLAADTTASHAITEHAGLTGSATADTSSTTLTFTDVDLSDMHTVTLGAPAATWSAGPLAGLTAADTSALNTALASALSYTLTDSTQTGAGSIAVAFSAADHAFDFLAAGETLTVVYNVTVADNNGAPSTQPVTFVVTGTNDAPVLAADASASHVIAEHTGLTGSATADTSSTTLTFTDVDLSDMHTVTLGAPAATWSVGPLTGLTAADTAALNTALASALSYTLTDSTLTGAGSIAIAFSAHDSAFDFLAAGQTLTVIYTVTVTDTTGATSTQPVTFVVTGTNDAPVLAADTTASHAITELVSTTGSATADTSSTTLTFTDVDLSDAHTVTLGAPVATWSVGPLTGLTAADTTALNTALASALSYALTDSTLTGAGSIAVAFSAHDSAFDFLAAGERLTVVYTVTVTDTTGATSTQPVTFVVTGANDAPVLAADTTVAHAITEHAGLTGSSTADTSSTTLTFTDVDLSDTHTVTLGAPAATWSAGPLAGLTAADTAALNTALASALSYTLTDSTQTGAGSIAVAFSAHDSAFDFLAAGQTLSVIYNVTVTDNTGATSTQPVTFVVTGTNDAPVLAVDTTASHAITELASTTGSATADTSSTTLTFTDVDLSDAHTVTLGTPAATWSFGPLTGLTAADTAALNTALASALSYTLTDSTQTGAGSIAIAFSAHDSAFDFLAAGQTLTVIYTVTVTDTTGATSTQPVTFVVTGTNDAPVLAADTAHVLTALAVPSADIGLQGLVEHANTYGDSTVATGHAYFATGGVAQATFIATTFDYFAANNATTLTGFLNANGGLDGNTLSADQTVSTDDTYIEFKGYVLEIAGQSYTVALTADDGAALALNGQTVISDDGIHDASQTFTYAFTASTTGYVPIELDYFEHTGVSVLALTLNGQAFAPGQLLTAPPPVLTSSANLSFTDVDLSDTHTVTVGAPTATWSAGALSGLTPADTALLNSALSGALTETLSDTVGTGVGSVALSFSASDAAFVFLAAGQTLTIVYNVTVTDNHGATSTEPVTFTITGTSDAPVFTTGVAAGAVTEQAIPNGNLTTTGSIGFVDFDLTDTHAVSVAAIGTTLGTLTLSETDTTGGTGGAVGWSYSVADSAIEYLAAGQTKVESFLVTVDDGHGGVITKEVDVTITGTNQAPVAVADTLQNTLAATTTSTIAASTLLANDTDPDRGDTLTIHAVSGTSADGATVTLSNGTITYDPTHAATIQAVAVGHTIDDTFTYTIADPSGATSTATVTLNVAGSYVAPVAVADTATTHEDAAVLINVLGHDTDHDPVTTLSIVSGSLVATHGTATVQNGQLLFTPAAGFAGTATISYVATDGVSNSNAATATVTVNPIAPTLSVPASLTANEGGSVALNISETPFDVNDPVSIRISGLPTGASLSAGIHNSDGSYTLTPAQLSGLSLSAGSAVSTSTLSVTATNTGGSTASTTQTIPVSVVNGWTGDTLGEVYYFPTLQTVYQSQQTFVVPTSGINGANIFSLAVGAASITASQFVETATFTSDPFNGFEVFDTSRNPLISGVTIDASTNMAGFNASDITFTSTAVYVNWQGLSFNSGTIVKLDLTFDPPLDPAHMIIAQTLDGSAAPTSNAGMLTVTDGTGIALVGTITNTGTIAVNGDADATAIAIDGTVVLQGGGHVQLSENNENYIYGNSDGATLVNVDNTITGGGDLGNGSLTLDNAGTIKAQGAYALIVDTGDHPFVNTGTIEADAGTLIVKSAETGGGHAVITSGTIEFLVASDAHVAFTGDTGTLALDQSQAFTGTVAGFSGHDQIDLGDVGFGTGSTFGYTANADGTGGVLTVSDGTHATALALLGTYTAASFGVASDGHGGTLLSDLDTSVATSTDPAQSLQIADLTAAVAAGANADTITLSGMGSVPNETGTVDWGTTTSNFSTTDGAFSIAQALGLGDHTAILTLMGAGTSTTSTIDINIGGNDAASFTSSNNGPAILVGSQNGVAQTITGTQHADTLVAGNANDIFTGNGGGDTFVFKTNIGNDTITDLHTAATSAGPQDMVDVSAFHFASYQALLNATVETGDNAVISLAGHTLTLDNVKVADLHSDLFHI